MTTDPEFLPGVPGDKLRARLLASPGNEMKSGKFASPESSAALVVNAFGWFVDRAASLPPVSGGLGVVRRVEVEAEMRFPWAGGTHPWLDAAIETDRWIVGVESKRYEPFRPAKKSEFAESYDRPVWGEAMERYSSLRRTFANGARRFACLDMVQLVKHAYGLRTEGQRRGKRALLLYVYAEPATWANGKPVDPARIAAHRADVALFADTVAGDEVTFASLRWADLMAQWAAEPKLADHAARVLERFGPL